MYSLATRRLGAGRGRQRGAQSSLRFATSADDEICFLMSLPWLTKHRQSQQAHEMNFIGICCVILYIFSFLLGTFYIYQSPICVICLNLLYHTLFVLLALQHLACVYILMPS